jgi:hypothetical protein
LPYNVESLATRQLALKLDDLTAGRHAIIDTGMRRSSPPLWT